VRVIEMHDRNQHGSRRRHHAAEPTRRPTLRSTARRACQQHHRLAPERVIREGETAEQVLS